MAGSGTQASRASRAMSRPLTRLLSLLVLVVAATAACAGPRHASSRTPPIIAVTGRGEISARPDMALVQLGADARRPTLAEATAEVAQQMGRVLERVRALGVRAEDVTTVRYGVEPLVARRADAEDMVRIVGYRATNVVQVKIREIAAVGRVVDAAVAAGANVLHGVRFSLEDREAAEAQARARAVAAAHAQATQLAHAAGVRLGPLLFLTEGLTFRPFEGAPGQVMALETRAPGPIESGEMQVVITVEARYRILGPEAR